MKHILFLLLFLPILAYAQYPASPNKIRLGNQTTADGLVVRTAASPSWTPTTVNNAWLAFDTVAVKLYYYDGGTWNEYTGGSVNIGNTDLTLTGNRRLNTGGYQLWIQDGTGAEVPYIFIGGDQVSFAASATTSVYLDSSEQRAAIIAGAVIDIDADSIRIIGTQPNDNSLNRLLAWDTITNRLKYVDKASIAGGSGTDTNFAEDNLTFSGNRVHNLSTRTLTIADGGTYPTFQQSAATDGITLASSATDIIAQTPGLLQIENSDTITITADRIRMNAADTRIQQIQNDNALNRLAAIDSVTGRLYYIDKSSIVTTPPNTIYSDDDVIDGNRVVYLDGNNSLKFADSTDNVLFQIGVGATPYIAQAVTDGTSITNITSSAQAQEIGANGVEWVNSFTVDTSGFNITGDGLTKDNALNRILVVDSLTNRIRYLDKSSISGSGGGMTSWTLAGTSGTPQTVSDGETATVAAGVGISTTASATRTVTVAADTATILASKTYVTTRGYTTGTGTTNTLAKWTSSTALGNSLFTDDGTNTVAGGTSSFRLPNGTTAQQPGSPAAGMTRYNTSNGALEYYGAAAWEIPVKSAGSTGLGTNTRIAFSNAAGRLTESANLTWDGFKLNFQHGLTSTNLFVRGGNNTVTGANNISVGASALSLVTSGSANVAIGPDAARSLTTGANNFALGSGALRLNQTGSNNIAVGAEALYGVASNSHNHNVGVGSSAGYGITTGNENTFIGGSSGYANTTGLRNTYISYRAGRFSTTGGYNIAIGFQCFGYGTGTPFAGADRNTIIGYEAGYSLGASDDGNVMIGNNAGYSETGSNTLYIENSNTTTPLIGGDFAANTVGINTAIGSIARTLHVTGEVRITDLTTDTPTQIVGADADGDLGAITVGSGLSLSSGTLSATGLSYNFAELTVSGGSTSATAGTPERPDNDTPGSASSTIVGSFTASGSTLDYTGSAGQGKLSAVISFTTSGGGDVLVSIYREGTQIASTEMREAVNAIYTTVALPTVTTSIATNDTFELRVEPVTGSNTITVHRQTLFVEKIY